MEYLRRVWSEKWDTAICRSLLDVLFYRMSKYLVRHYGVEPLAFHNRNLFHHLKSIDRHDTLSDGNLLFK